MPPCPECAYESEATGADQAVAALRSFGPAFAGVLTPAPAWVATRSSPSVWSALEYTAHTRDALAWYGDRIERVLTVDRPQLTPFDWDAACEERRYRDEDPAVALKGLGAVAAGLAERLAELPDPSWERAGIGSDGGERTVLALARRAVHEGVHHLLDVHRVLAAVERPGPPAGTAGRAGVTRPGPAICQAGAAMREETESGHATGSDGDGARDAASGDEPMAGGPWAALVVLITATALFFAAFALLYCLSSLFRPGPPTLGRTSPTTTTTSGLEVSPAPRP